VRCEACGVEFDKHLGIVGTCAKLKKAEAEVERLNGRIRKLKVELAVLKARQGSYITKEIERVVEERIRDFFE